MSEQMQLLCAGIWIGLLIGVSGTFGWAYLRAMRRGSHE
jgi:hypothetical protein